MGGRPQRAPQRAAEGVRRRQTPPPAGREAGATQDEASASRSAAKEAATGGTAFGAELRGAASKGICAPGQRDACAHRGRHSDATAARPLQAGPSHGKQRPLLEEGTLNHVRTILSPARGVTEVTRACGRGAGRARQRHEEEDPAEERCGGGRRLREREEGEASTATSPGQAEALCTGENGARQLAGESERAKNSCGLPQAMFLCPFLLNGEMKMSIPRKTPFIPVGGTGGELDGNCVARPQTLQSALPGDEECTLTGSRSPAQPISSCGERASCVQNCACEDLESGMTCSVI